MSSTASVAVFGASGFVGSAVCRVLEEKGFQVKPMRGPRLAGMSPAAAFTYLESEPSELAVLAAQLQAVDLVVNAAGVPDATSTDLTALVAANGALPGLIAKACVSAGIRRLVHVSSAAVQGRLPVLDASETADAFSDYSKSKLLGEQLVRHFGGGMAVVYRPPGVHGIDRAVTRRVARFASGPFASVASPGTAPSPQALIIKVAEAVVFLATTESIPPAIVNHPWEGLTTSNVMKFLGGHDPVKVPKFIAKAVVVALTLAGRIVPRLAGTARRVDMLWFGQEQAVSWLTTVGWHPPTGTSGWVELGRAFHSNTQPSQGHER